MGGRGSSLGLSDGPQGGNGGELKYGQPNTPITIMPANIRQAIGSKGKPIAPDEAAKNVNPYRDVEWGDYSANCQRCVIAYELNRRGYKVEAREAYGDRDPYPVDNNYLKAFKGATITDVGARTTKAVNSRILKEMKQWGEGSRGIVKVAYNSKEGHVFNVEYRNGKLNYYDAQTGERYRESTVFNHVQRSKVAISRVDNLDINDDVRHLVRKR